MAKETKKNPHEIITEQIIAALDRGTVPWSKPWIGGGHESVLGHQYRGLNPFLLSMSADAQGFTSRYWAGFGTAKKLGGFVRKGERGTIITKWNVIEKEDPKTGEVKTRGLLRYLRVWNTEQIDGLKWSPPAESGAPVDPLAAGEAVLEGMPNPPKITIQQSDRAYYRPSDDSVMLPELAQYARAEDFYRVAFHELAHSTGHEKRLERDLSGSFGREDYAKEELIAELTAAMLLGATGISSEIEQSAAYIDGWRKALTDDPRLIVTAASAAQKAADYITDEAAR